ncbi:MAG: GatB/YqeY domain-containing protein [Polyangia bacterium]
MTPSLRDRLAQDLTTAMKARDSLRTDVLRMVKTSITNREIEKRADLDESETLRVLQTLVKQREDSIDQFRRGGRPELADREQAEIDILRGYLPAEASDEEIAAAVDAAAKESGATTMKDMGKVMKAALATLKTAGKPADGKRVNEAVKRRLGG